METRSDLIQVQSAIMKQAANLSYLLRGEFCAAAPVVSAVAFLVLLVGWSRIPPQIFQPIILSIAVVMTALVTIRSRTKECLGYQRRDGSHLAANGNSAVTVRAVLKAENLAGLPDLNDTRNAADSPPTARFVAGEARNWTPDFFGDTVAVRHADLLKGSCVQGRADASTSVRPAHFHHSRE